MNQLNKRGGYMKSSYGAMPQNVVKYVAMGTKLINLVLLVCHIGYGILFWVYDAYVLFGYNCLNSIAFLFACVMLRRKKKWTYIITLYLGIFFFCSETFRDCHTGEDRKWI